MLSSTEVVQHGCSVLVVGGFPQNFAIEDDDRISANHETGVNVLGYRPCLAHGEQDGVVRRGIPWRDILRLIADDNVKRYAERLEQRLAPR